MRVKTLLGVSLVSFLIMSCGGGNRESGFPNPISEMDRLKQQLKTAKEDHDPVTAGRLQFEINYKAELEKAGDDPLEQQRIHRKYDVLRQVFEDEARNFEENSDIHPLHRPSFTQGIGMETANEPYDGPNFSSVYHPLALEEVQKVFKDFGPLYVNVTMDQKNKPGFQTVKADVMPWSGAWYPFSDKSLYTGENAPLAKFDALMKKKGVRSNIIEEERKRFEGVRHDGWEGMCYQRAIASTLVPEPRGPISIEGIQFSVADQKAIHTFAHRTYPQTVYGVVYKGNAETDGTYQDLKPEALHQMIMTVVGTEKRALVLDDTAGQQIWFKPLYNYRYKIEKDPKYDFAFLVKAYALLVKERTVETDLLTDTQKDVISFTYTYRLYVDKKDVKDGKYRVIAGQWTGDSFRDHPDMVSYLHKVGEPKSHSEAFNKNIGLYKSLFMNSSSSVR